MRKLKLFSLSAILSMILFLLALPVPAKAANAYVIDEAGMLTTDELLALNNLAEEISLRQECGVYVIITKDMHGYSESKFAQGIFMNYDLGYDRGDSEGASGVLLAISYGDSYYDSVAYGAASGTFTTSKLDRLNDIAYDYLSQGDWNGCADAFIRECDNMLTQSGYTYYVPQYTDSTIAPTEVVTSPAQRRARWLGTLPFAGAISAGIGAVSVFFMKGKNKTTRIAKEADRYIINNGIRVTVSQEHFTHKTRTVTHVHRDSGGGGGSSGGGHSYHSSGFSHSSGGGHF